jgi:hypothetical protein
VQAESAICTRPDCEEVAAPEALYCPKHMRSVMGLDTCKASGCEENVLAGQMWCAPHLADREAGRLNPWGEHVLQPPGFASADPSPAEPEPEPGLLCRIEGCQEAALESTIDSASARWRRLCREHYDEQRSIASEARRASAAAETITPPGEAILPHYPFCALDEGHAGACLDWAERTGEERERLHPAELAEPAPPLLSPEQGISLGRWPDLERALAGADLVEADPFEPIIRAWARSLAACFDSISEQYARTDGFAITDVQKMLGQAVELMEIGRRWMEAAEC